MPTLSIIIPVYNAEAYLPRCLDSILATDYSDYEIVLVNDGSADRSGAICDDYARAHKFIKPFHQERLGVSAARNHGLALASGDYIFFVDSDDRIEKEGLKAVMDTLTADASLQIACFGYYKAYDNGEKKERALCSGEKNRISLQGEELYYGLLDGIGYIWNKIWRRDLLSGLLFDEKIRYGEDTLFVFQALQRCDKAMVFGVSLYCYSVGRASSATGAALSETSIEYLRVNRRVFEQLRDSLPTVGMSRCFTAAKTVLSKIPNARGYEEYYRQIRRTLRFSPGEIAAYLSDKKLRDTWKQRLESLGVLLFPHCVVLVNQIRRRP